jgi:hypothetical protein
LGAGSTNNHPIPVVPISLELCLKSVPLSFPRGEVVCYYLNGKIKTVLFDKFEERKEFEKQLVIKQINFVGLTMYME